MKYLILLVSFSLIGASAWATPAQVLIIRHGEKISDDETGLSPKGKKRAEALVSFFKNDPSVTQFGPPVAIYAAAPKHEDSSNRAYETVAPTARALHLKVIMDFDKGDPKRLAEEVLEEEQYDGRTVLISWVHDRIPKLAEKFGAKRVPDEWDGDRFDRVWRITFRGDKAGPVEDIPQHALPGDSR